MGLFAKAGYQPLGMGGKTNFRFVNLDTSKSDTRLGVLMAQEVAQYEPESYDALLKEQHKTIEIVQDVLSEQNDERERYMLARHFADGWFLGSVEVRHRRARHGQSSDAALFALALLRETANEAAWGGVAMEAGYFARRSGAPAEVFRGYLVEGAVFTG